MVLGVNPQSVDVSMVGIVVRPWLIDDVDQLVEAYGDPQVREWTPVSEVQDKRLSAWEFLSHADLYWCRGMPNFAIVDGLTLAGAIGFVDRRNGDELEIAFWLVESARRKGIATNVIAAVCHWAEMEIGATTINADIIVGNWRSKRCLLRCGFALVDTLVVRPTGFEDRRSVWRMRLELS